MLTILFLLLHLARNRSWIMEKLGLRKGVKNASGNIVSTAVDTSSMRRINPASREIKFHSNRTAEPMITSFNREAMDESSWREEMSRLSIAAELSARKRSA